MATCPVHFLTSGNFYIFPVLFIWLSEVVSEALANITNKNVRRLANFLTKSFYMSLIKCSMYTCFSP